MIAINKPAVGAEEADAVRGVIESGVLTDKSGAGARVCDFEANFAKYVGSKYAVAVTSGTAALHIALLAAGIKPRSRIVIPSFTFHATAEAVRVAGARPRFADIDPRTYAITAETAGAVMSRKVEALMPVHLYGLPAELDGLLALARERGIPVIEDAAQAHGAEYRGRMVGSIGDMSCFSFYASKNLTTCEGGMVTTNDGEYAGRLRALRSHGEERPYWQTSISNNYHMDEVRAAIGSVQLRRLPGFLERRRANAGSLNGRLKHLEGALTLPEEPEGRKSAWNLYTLRLNGSRKDRDALVAGLREKGIGAAVYYESPVHEMPLYAGSRTRTLPNTSQACAQVFSIPVHPSVSADELEFEAATLEQLLTRQA